MDLKKLIFTLLLPLLIGCGSSYTLNLLEYNEHVTQWQFTPAKPTEKTLLYLGPGINEPDSIPKEIIETFINKGYTVVGVEKYDSKMGYTRVINTDTRDLRIQTISDFLQNQDYQHLVIYGRGEGGIIAPQIANNFRAKGLIVSESPLVSSKEYYEQVLTCGCAYKDSISELMDLTSDENWMEFMTSVEQSPTTGKAWNGRSSRQFASYWNYETLGYIQQFQAPVLVINNPKSPVYKKEYSLLADQPNVTWVVPNEEQNAISKYLGSL